MGTLLYEAANVMLTSRAAPSLPHQVPNEHAESAGTRKRRHPEEPPALDPLENAIRRFLKFDRSRRVFALQSI